ncbi:MAG: alkaline phosphatase family protein [Balneolaceae bacterium]|nr:alkaline phosphatase family protein [Balneolaceae bacterium]
MKNIFFKSFFGIILFSVSWFLANPTSALQVENDATDEETYIVIISIDGFPASALWDHRIPLNTIRSLAQNGVWSTHFAPSTPTVTWPNHTTLVTGVYADKHGVLTNGRFLQTHVGMGRYSNLDREQLTSHSSIYDVAYQAGMITAEVNWPVTRNAETLHFSLPDAPNAITNTTPQLVEELIEAGILQDDTDATFRSGGILRHDEVWTATAEHLIINHQPNVLLFHLLNVDGTHHEFGEGTRPGLTALTLADTQVKRIVEALETAGIRDRTALFIVSDHGFMNVTRQVHPNVLLRQHGLIELDEDGNMTNARVQAISNGGTAMVFTLNEETQEDDLAKAYEILNGAEGISRVLKPEEYHEYGLPQPESNPNMGNLLLNADQHVSFGNNVTGDQHILDLDGVRGTHGYLSDVPEMKTIFVVSGYGIKSGLELGRIDNRSVAPTAARILGLVMDQADGLVLDEILID